ncbi:hypothetical protein PInf_024157 [Phytophthora infestans]|nr:hypothetical protein PInf_024157 [Phytophthora infestans]
MKISKELILEIGATDAKALGLRLYRSLYGLQLAGYLCMDSKMDMRCSARLEKKPVDRKLKFYRLRMPV